MHTRQLTVVLTNIEVADRVLIVELESELAEALVPGSVARPPRGGHRIVVAVLPTTRATTRMDGLRGEPTVSCRCHGAPRPRGDD